MDLEDFFDRDRGRGKHGYRDHEDDDGRRDGRHRGQNGQSMELEDLFDRGRGKQGYRDHDDHDDRPEDGYRGQHGQLGDRGWLEGSSRSHDDHGVRRGHHGDGLFDMSHVAQRLLANKALLILAVVVALAVVALLAVFGLPLLGQAIDYLDKNGLKGVVDRLLQGSGGGK